VRVLPVTLLILLGLAGLHGAVAQPRWNGPLHRDGVVIGIILEVALCALLVITLHRRAAPGADSQASNPVADKLRRMLTAALSLAIVAVAVIILVGLHLHLFAEQQPPRPRPVVAPGRTHTVAPPGVHAGNSGFHIPVGTFLYILFIVVLLAGVAVSIWWARRLRPSGRPVPDGVVVEDPEDLREAVESGRSALRAVDDARAAIIACYLAMENSLAERGAARGVADTPDELLARATKSGLVRGSAAARLTALFYEARFSSHPLDYSQREAAERALDELAAALAEPAQAGEAVP
jgi:Domain of unknown function (DUF4129)